MDAYTSAIDSKDSNKGPPLGKLAVDLVTFLTVPGEDFSEVSDELILSIPILNVYGQIEKDYNELRQLV